jgi:hypothetical protein
MPATSRHRLKGRRCRPTASPPDDDRPSVTAHETCLVRCEAIRRTLGPAAAPARPRPDEAIPVSPVATDDLELLDEEDLRALTSGWTFVE